MYARLVRFEGADPDTLQREIDGMREQIERGPMEEDPSGQMSRDDLAMLQDAIKRVLLLADSDKGSSAMVVFSDTEDEIRKIDELFNRMSPGDGGGKRQSADIYEVEIDKTFS